MMRSPPIPASFFLFVLLCFLPLSVAQSSLSRGSSLSVERATDVLMSPDGNFTCGFHGVGTNAFAFSIWFAATTPTVWPVWTANRDAPVNGRGSKLRLRRDGSLVLVDVDKTVMWSTNTSSMGAEIAELLDTGNLVVKNAGGEILWQSFGSPTHTLLPTQPMTKSTKLVSSMSSGSPSSGYHTFYFDSDNILKLIYNGLEVSSIYWPNPDHDIFQNGRTKYNISRYAVLDEVGRFSSSDKLGFNASDSGHRLKRRLTLDPDGNLRLYSLRVSTRKWRVSWQAMSQPCSIHGQCGMNGICVYAPEPICSCPPGYEVIDPGNWKRGCRRKVELTCGRLEPPLKFVEMPFTDFYGFNFGFTSNISFNSCRQICEEHCACQAFGYRAGGSGQCFPKAFLFNGYTSPNFPGSTHLKFPMNAEVTKSPISVALETPYCNSARAEQTSNSSGVLHGRRKGTTKWFYLYGFVSAFGLIEVLFIASGWWFVHGWRRTDRSIEEGYRMISNQLKKFTYGELKRATENFKHELGRGGAGAVYKGILDDQRVVAVKKLDNVMQGAEEFQAEMSLMGRIYHMNLVRVWGFCSERSHRLLVSEYVEKGSLAQVLFGDVAAPLLEWSKRFRVALGTAKGLAYLHHECLEWIVHCDIKPENILLDGDFEPKIADFGLAKLSQRSASPGLECSRIRGTKGYMAPEWIMNFPITAKVDVYSYGVVLLETVMGRRISSAVAEGEAEVAELRWLVGVVKENIDTDELQWVGGFVDPRLEGQFSRKQAAVMLQMAVCCLEEEKSKRPSMEFVAETLLGCGQQN